MDRFKEIYTFPQSIHFLPPFQISEGSMTHKMAAAPPSNNKSHKSEEIQNDSNREDARKNKPEAKMGEFGYVATNQK